MDPLDVIILYGYRFKIELSFRHALHVVGSYAYHFWTHEPSNSTAPSRLARRK
jgi:hypothetical protein